MYERLKSGWQRIVAGGLAASVLAVTLGALPAQAQDKRRIDVKTLPPVAESNVKQNETTVEERTDNLVVFTNSTPIALPGTGTAGPGSPYPSNITVSGQTGTITDINVRINGFSHTFPDDVAYLLVSPDGTKKFILQSDVGGSADVSNITYTFDDQASAGIPDDGPFPANNASVRPTSVESEPGETDGFPAPAPAAPYSQPAPTGSATLNGVFGGINPNGEWKLYTIDFFNGDSGSISGGWSLDITLSPPTGATPKPCFDFFGSGRTSFATVTASATEYTWRLQNNGGVGSETVSFGFPGTSPSNQDSLTPGYFDADNRADINVWRPAQTAGGQSVYYVRPSTAPTTILGVSWGTAGDVARREADYDGDGRDDPTVVRNVSNVWTWYYLRSSDSTFRAISFGAVATGGGALIDFPLPGADYAGDSRADIVVLRQNAAGQSDTFFVADSNTGALTLSRSWGEFDTDFYVTGDYIGDAKADFAVWRGNGAGTNGSWYILENGGSSNFLSFQWGVAGAPANRDLPVCGDYNGDGKSDVAVYRRSNATYYWVNSGATPSVGVQTVTGATANSLPVGALRTF